MTASRHTGDGDPDYAELAPLFEKLAASSGDGSAADDPERASVRERLITAYLPVAKKIARRFSHRGEPHEDLVQVATVGLVQAVDRFDPGRGVDFLAFAVPTMMGSVRKHFRDTGWSMRVPRRLQELHMQISAASGELTQRLGHAPTPSEIAEHLGLPVDDIYDGMQAADAYQAESLERPQGHEDGLSLSEGLGEDDPALLDVEQREVIGPLIAQLPPRERRILLLRFVNGMTQSQIAEQVGISQMHVSRLLNRTLNQLREQLQEADRHS